MKFEVFASQTSFDSVTSLSSTFLSFGDVVEHPSPLLLLLCPSCLLPIMRVCRTVPRCRGRTDLHADGWLGTARGPKTGSPRRTLCLSCHLLCQLASHGRLKSNRPWSTQPGTCSMTNV